MIGIPSHLGMAMMSVGSCVHSVVFCLSHMGMLWWGVLLDLKHLVCVLLVQRIVQQRVCVLVFEMKRFFDRCCSVSLRSRCRPMSSAQGSAADVGSSERTRDWKK